MSRFKQYDFVRDQFGGVIPSASVYIYKAGTETLVTIYDANSAGSSSSSGPQITTDSNGLYEFWVDDGDYDHDQKFKIKVTKTGYDDVEIDFIDVFPNITNYLMPQDGDGNSWYMRPEGGAGGLEASKTKGDIVT